MATRQALMVEYDRLALQLHKAGTEPVVSVAVLDTFSDAELKELVKDCVRRLIQLRRLEL